MRKGIQVRPHEPSMSVLNKENTTVVEFFDWNTGQSGRIEIHATPARNVTVTTFRHTERVSVGEGQKERR